MNIQVQALKTKVFYKDNDLYQFLANELQPTAMEGKILVITSKLVSLFEQRTIKASHISKSDLIKNEADVYLCESGFGAELTIKHGLLIPSAGIDESNSENGDYILYPRKPYESVQNIGQFLKQNMDLKNFGVILADSHSTPLRKGVIGISLAHWGFLGSSSLVGRPDIFGKPLKFTHVDIVDSLAAIAVLAMGEANECTPLALISGANIVFTENSSEQDIRIEPENDLYYPLLKNYLTKSK